MIQPPNLKPAPPTSTTPTPPLTARPAPALSRPVQVELPTRQPTEPSNGARRIRPAYDLLALDIDGTLLRSDKRLSTANTKAIGRAVSAGVQVVLASARPPRSMRVLYQRLKLSTLMVNYNGALICDPVHERTVYHQPLNAEAVSGIVRLARRLNPDVLVHLEVKDRWITDRHDPCFQTATSASFAPDVYGPLKPYLKKPVTKLMLMGDPAGLEPIKQALAAKFAAGVDIHITDDNLLQIVAKGVDKGQALDRIARLYGVSEHRVMAIGDAPNDVGMLKRAGLGLAMGNGWEQTKQAADHVIGSNDEDAVAQAIDFFLLAG